MVFYCWFYLVAEVIWNNNYLVKLPLFYTFLIFYAFNVCLLNAHDGSYEMNYENFIAHNQGFSTEERVLTAKVLHKEGYSELLLYSEEGGKMNIEFNNHSRNYLSKDPENDPKHYSVSTWGWYNTISYKSGDIAYLWHGRPIMHRNNHGLGEIERKFFETIMATGRFEYLIEKNWGILGVSAEEFPHMPAKERVFKVLIQLTNPEVIEDFLLDVNQL